MSLFVEGFCVSLPAGSQVPMHMQRRQSGLKSGGLGSGYKKFRFFQANFQNISTFSGQKILVIQSQLSHCRNFHVVDLNRL